MSTADIAKERNVKRPTVTSWCRKGWLPAERVGRDYRVRRSDWESFLQRGLRPAKKANGPAASAARPSTGAVLLP
ncbi:helix-turn-helix domain-containing protein [Kouleothrix sp.]|uniref:helix-turn-helix domain-containing protein n=1 Tax=Kouleothrix sp. TaxID=2779161 RepID=UPI00391CA6D6